MPSRSIIERLPVRLRAQLDRRVRAAVYGDMIKIAAWLTAAGHPIKKTQVGRYAQKLRASDAAALATVSKMSPADQLRCAELRLACLQAAISTGDKKTVIARADRFVEWTFNGSQIAPADDRAMGK